MMVTSTLSSLGKTLGETQDALHAGGMHVAGLIHLNQGFILGCMIWAAAAVAIIEKGFFTAALWMVAAGLLSAFGILHSYQMIDGNVANHFGLWTSPEFTCAYLLVAVLMAAFGCWIKLHPQETSGPLE